MARKSDKSQKKETKVVKKPKRTRTTKKNKKLIKETNVFPILLVIIIILLSYGYILYQYKNGDKTEKIDLKDNEILYKDYIYTLPEGWEKNEDYPKALNVTFKTTQDGIDSYSGGVVYYKKIASTGHDLEYVFKDPSFIKENLTEGSPYIDLGEGIKTEHNGNPVIIFPAEYSNGNNSKVLLAFTPANEEYFYNIQFYSNKVVDNVDELYFNYDGLNSLLEFLSNGISKESRILESK